MIDVRLAGRFTLFLRLEVVAVTAASTVDELLTPHERRVPVVPGIVGHTLPGIGLDPTGYEKK